jgi:small subunit ribosomal protein S2
MAVITMRQLLEAGVHFGHQTRRWNPKMRRFIFGERNGIYIIDLEQTLSRVERAYGFVRDLVAGGGVLMFVGTKKQAQDPVRSFAEKCGMPYVNERWLGGMLTNFDTIAKRINKMLEYERMQRSGEFDAMPKKEALLLTRELEKLRRNLGGLREMTRRPDAIFVLDTKKESIAVTEANKLGIPVVAVVDTNVDPELVQYPIPGNDDAIRANSLLARVIADAVEEGRFIAAKREPAAPRPSRSTEEEAEFNAQQAAARREAMAAQAARDRRLESPADPTLDEPDVTGSESPVADVITEGEVAEDVAAPLVETVAEDLPADVETALTETVGDTTAESAGNAAGEPTSDGAEAVEAEVAADPTATASATDTEPATETDTEPATETDTEPATETETENATETETEI